jgi:hypothetical protein
MTVASASADLVVTGAGPTAVDMAAKIAGLSVATGPLAVWSFLAGLRGLRPVSVSDDRCGIRGNAPQVT